MSIFLIVIYLYCIVNAHCLTESPTVLPELEEKREQTHSTSPLVFLFNKARRKFANSLDIDLSDLQSIKSIPLTRKEVTTDELPHVIVKIKTSDKARVALDDPIINMTKYIVDDDKLKSGEARGNEAPGKPAIRVLNLTKNMFDYNAQKIYHTVNGIRLRLSKEHDQRIILQMVQKQVENGLRELKTIKEKCDRDYVMLNHQKKVALEKLQGLKAVMKQKKELDENLSRLLDNAIAFNFEGLGP